MESKEIMDNPNFRKIFRKQGKEAPSLASRLLMKNRRETKQRREAFDVYVNKIIAIPLTKDITTAFRKRVKIRISLPMDTQT
jgi:hypothetical protein